MQLLDGPVFATHLGIALGIIVVTAVLGDAVHAYRVSRRLDHAEAVNAPCHLQRHAGSPVPGDRRQDVQAPIVVGLRRAKSKLQTWLYEQPFSKQMLNGRIVLRVNTYTRHIQQSRYYYIINSRLTEFRFV